MRLAIADREGQHPLHAELSDAVAGAAVELGIAAERIADPAREHEFDVLLLMGYPHFYPAFAGAPRAARRISWFGENLPTGPASAGQRIYRALPSARLLDVAHDSIGRLAGQSVRRRLLAMREQAAMERELGANLEEMKHARQWIDELVVVSGNRAIGAQQSGWHEVRIVPFGYHESFAGPLVPADSPGRDIDVLFLGRDLDARVRRARGLAEFRTRLADRAQMVVVDGGLYGAERHALIARTRIVLDIHRIPSNSTGMRYLLATAGGAALVNEETLDDWLPELDRHVVEVPAERLADEVMALLNDEPRRRRLVDTGQQLLRDELSMRNCLQRVLNVGADNIPTSA